MKVINKKKFGNGDVYVLETDRGKIVETTDTFLPYYTKDAVGRRQNTLINSNYGSRNERWMIGISTMSGCPVGCKFCATGGKFKGNLTAEEMVEQVDFIVRSNQDYRPEESDEFRILITRMGEPALNYEPVTRAVELLKEKYPYSEIAISTIGIRNSALEEWLALSERYKDIHLQFSVHSTSEKYRDWLIPYRNKMNLEEIAKFGERWMAVPNNKRKISLNFTLTEDAEFDVDKLEQIFPRENFFIKLSPVNDNDRARQNKIAGAIKQVNLA